MPERDWWQDYPWRLIQTNLREIDMANIDAIQRPPLPADVRRRLVEMFDGVDCVSGQEPPLRESYAAS